MREEHEGFSADLILTDADRPAGVSVDLSEVSTDRIGSPQYSDALTVTSR